MNIYFIIIIGIIVFNYALSFIVRTLNLRALDPKLPQEFMEFYDQEKYLKSQKYTKTNSKFSYITSTFSLIITLVFILGGLYNTFDLYARTLGYGEIITGIFFFALLSIITDLLTMPFSLYSTFVIEERYGFNKTTLKTFLLDKFKQYILMMIIGIPVLYLVLYFFGNFGDYAWVYVWIFLVSFSVVMQPVFNMFIAPMFNKFTPLEDGPLLEKIRAYLTKVNFPVKKLEVMDGSRRSAHSNAYFSGIGRYKRIALFDTLIKQMDEDEIVSIIAHEVGHYKLNHIYRGIALGAIQSGLMLFILSLFLMNSDLFAVFKMENLSIYASLLFFSILYTPISIIADIFFSIISRKNEFSADEYSAKTAGMPEALITGLKKMSKENLSNLTPHWLNVFLNYSHPPVLDRIKALREYNG